MHYFSNLFDKVLYMFQKSPLSTVEILLMMDSGLV